MKNHDETAQAIQESIHDEGLPMVMKHHINTKKERRLLYGFKEFAA